MGRSITIGVHGFQYDPESTNPKDDAWGELYPIWSKELGDCTEFVGFEWYSYPMDFKGFTNAWAKGCYNRYLAAWKDSEDKAAPALIKMIEEIGKPVNIIAHSLGTRVVLCAIEQSGGKLPIEKIILLSGADTVKHANQVKYLIKAPVLNVTCEEDDVLGYLGKWFSPDLGPSATIGRNEVKGWDNIHLINSDDHWDSYKTPSYWDMYRNFLKEK